MRRSSRRIFSILACFTNLRFIQLCVVVINRFPGFSVNVVALQQTLSYFVCSDSFVNILLSNRCRNEGAVTSGDSSLSSGSRGAFAVFGGKFSSFFGGVLQPTRHIGSTSISSFDLFIFLPAFRIDIVLQSLLCVSCVFLCSDQIGLLFCDCFDMLFLKHGQFVFRFGKFCFQVLHPQFLHKADSGHEDRAQDGDLDMGQHHCTA